MFSASCLDHFSLFTKAKPRSLTISQGGDADPRQLVFFLFASILPKEKTAFSRNNVATKTCAIMHPKGSDRSSFSLFLSNHLARFQGEDGEKPFRPCFVGKFEGLTQERHNVPTFHSALS